MNSTHITAPSFRFGDSTIEKQYIQNITDPTLLTGLTFSLALHYVVEAIKNPHLPVGEFRRLATHPERKVRLAVAGSPRTPAGVLGQMTNNVWESKKVFRKLASNPNTPAEALSFLAASEDMVTVRKVAGNPSTPIDTLWEIAENQHGWVVMGLFGRADLPADLLAYLRTHGDGDVQKAYYTSLYATDAELKEVFETYAHTSPQFVIEVVGGNSNSSPQLLADLFSMYNIQAVRELVFNDNLPESVIHGLFLELNFAIEKFERGEIELPDGTSLRADEIEPHTAVDIVALVDDMKHLLYHLLLLPNVPPSVFLSVIDKGDEFSILCALLFNPQLPQDMLELLTLHPSPEISKEAQRQTAQRALML